MSNDSNVNQSDVFLANLKNGKNWQTQIDTTSAFKLNLSWNQISISFSDAISEINFETVFFGSHYFPPPQTGAHLTKLSYRIL